MKIKMGRVALLCAAVFVLAGCDEGSETVSRNAVGGDSDGFRKQYLVARQALEDGKYAKADRTYLRLIETAGQLAPRLQLELSHSYLRSGQYDKAAAQAKALSLSLEGSSRSAALAVLATAQHEQGKAAMSSGKTALAKQYLDAAQSAIDVVLKNDPDLDPLGALAGRSASIKVQLAALGT